jgi:sec-independent protein translocase protein TatC
MTVVGHLEELRRRLVISVLAVAVAAIGAWFLYQPVFNILSNPYCHFMRQHRELAVRPAQPCALAYSSVIEPFLIKIKLVAFLGFAMALPVVLYQTWLFVIPGLTSRERRYALPFVLSSLALFALGSWFALFTLPRALDFLLGFAGTTRVIAVLTIGKYLAFVMLMIVAFGVSFEFPLILIFLTIVGVLSSQKLRRTRRFAYLGITVFAAVITPTQDWFTMTAMTVPLIVFYEVSILIARAMKR